MKNQIIKNIGSNYFVNFLQMLLGLLIIPFLIFKLGKDAFGLTVLAESLIAIFEIIAFSVRIALARHATFALARGSKEEFISYLSSGRYLLFACGVVVLLLGGTLSYFFPNIFHVPAHFEQQSRILFFLITAAFFITIPNIVYWSVLYSQQRFDLINMASSAGIIFRAAAIFVLFSFLPSQHISLVTYGCIYFVMRWFENFLIYVWHKRVMPELRLGIRHFQWAKMKEIFSFSGYTMLSNISNMLYDNTSNILINIFYGPALNALYAVSLKIPMTIKNFFLRATWTLTPTVTDLAAKKETARIEQLFFTYSKFVAIATIPLSIFIIFTSHQIISLWVGKDFQEAANLLAIHMLPLIVILPFEITNCVPNAYGKVKVPSQINFVIALGNVLLGIVLARHFSLGLYGFAISAAFCTFLSSGVFIPYYSSRITGIPLKKYILNVFIQPLLLAVGISIFGFVLVQALLSGFSTTFTFLFAEAALLLMVYYVCAGLLLLTPAEKDSVSVFFKIKTPGFNLCV